MTRLESFESRRSFLTISCWHWRISSSICENSVIINRTSIQLSINQCRGTNCQVLCR